MHLVREMKKYGHVQVANAIYAVGYRFRNPNCIPHNIEKMLQGLPRIVLARILNKLRSPK